MKFDRATFVDECRRAIVEDAPQRAVHEVVERAISKPAAVEDEFVYGSDFFSRPRLQWDPETGESKPFDVQSARAVLAAADAPARMDGTT